MIVTIDDMRARGKNGYVAKILPGGEKQFMSCAERTGYGTSRQQLTFQLTEDGIYEVSDANFGGRHSTLFIRIENGIECDRADTLAELIVAGVDLPVLVGSEKQVAWAHSIREKFLAKLLQANKEIPSVVKQETSAKFWINNRAKAVGQRILPDRFRAKIEGK